MRKNGRRIRHEVVSLTSCTAGGTLTEPTASVSGPASLGSGRSVRDELDKREESSRRWYVTSRDLSSAIR